MRPALMGEIGGNSGFGIARLRPAGMLMLVQSLRNQHILT
jgi:hypothetical protein